LTGEVTGGWCSSTGQGRPTSILRRRMLKSPRGLPSRRCDEGRLRRSVGEDDDTLGGARDRIRSLLPSRISGVVSINDEMSPDLVASSEVLASKVDDRPDPSSSTEGPSSAMVDVVPELLRDGGLRSQGGECSAVVELPELWHASSSTIGSPEVPARRCPLLSSLTLPMGDARVIGEGGLDACGGVLHQGDDPLIAGAEMSSAIPLVSPFSSLSTSTPFSVGVRSSAGDDDGSVMAADSMQTELVDAGVDRGKGLGFENLSMNMAVNVGLLTVDAASVGDCGKGLGFNNLVVFQPEMCSLAEGFSSALGEVSTESVSVFNSVDDGIVREEVRVSPTDREALRPQPTDGL
ncbi:hypothetical protein Dimus_037423, partial [Dionaea muscipula]